MKKLISFTILLFTISCTNPYEVETEDVVKYKSIYYSIYREKDYSEAVIQFQEFIKNYPWSSKVDNSFYYQGLSYIALKESEKAKESFQKILKNSSFYDEAQEQLSLIERGVM